MVPGQIPMQSATGQDMKAQAIGQAGQVINQTGNLLLELKAEQERQSLDDAELTLRSASKDLAGKLATNLNPENHLEEAQAFYNNVTEEILSKGGYSPRFEKEMTKRIGMFTESKMADIARDAKLMQLENGRRLGLAVVKQDIADKDFAGAKQRLGEMKGTHLSDTDVEIYGMEIDRFEKEDRWDGLARGGDKNVFNTEDMSDAQREKWKSKAEGYRQEIVSEQTDNAQEKIFSGEIISPDEIDKLTPDVDAKTRYALKKTLEGLHGEEAKRVMESPEFQAQVSGEIAAMIADYKPTASGRDEQRVKIREKIAMLPQGPMRQEFESNVAELKLGKIKEIKSVKDWALTQVDEHLKDGLYGNITKPKIPFLSKTLRQHVNDGFLDDSAKLKSLGFSDDQIEDIQNANEDTDSSFFGSLLPDNEVTMGARADKFKELWETRTGEVTADQDALLVANALAAGGRDGLDKELTKSVDEKTLEKLQKEARDANSKIMQKYAEDRQKLLDHLKLTPDIDVPKASEYLKQMKIEVGAGVTNEKWRSSRPTYDDVTGEDMMKEYNGFPLFDDTVGELDFGILPSLGEYNANE
jgi:hypothetical protein